MTNHPPPGASDQRVPASHSGTGDRHTNGGAASRQAAATGQAEPEPGGITRITPADLGLPEEGGEPACYAHLVCPECGSVVTEGHRPGCSEAPAD